jgi:hypothetical protein
MARLERTAGKGLRLFFACLVLIGATLASSCGGAASNPVPSITSLSPPSATVGAGARTLAINGTDFLSSSSVAYNDVDHTATFISSTQLTISLSAGDQTTVGAYAVVVTNPPPGGGPSNAINLAVNIPPPVQPVVFYVSTLGNDSWSGSLPNPNPDNTDGPFATLARAQAAIRGLNQNTSGAQRFTVYIRGGQYNLAAPLVFTPQDSGTAANPITYAAYSNEVPVLSGGQTISGWQAGGSTAGGQQVWTAQVPGVVAGNWYFRQLFVNGVRRQRARTPNTGFFYVNGNVTTGSPSSFTYNEGDINPMGCLGGRRSSPHDSLADYPKSHRERRPRDGYFDACRSCTAARLGNQSTLLGRKHP